MLEKQYKFSVHKIAPLTGQRRYKKEISPSKTPKFGIYSSIRLANRTNFLKFSKKYGQNDETKTVARSGLEKP